MNVISTTIYCHRFWFSILFLFFLCARSAFAESDGLTFFDQQIKRHQNLSGVFILDKGEQSLLARAWLADHAQKSIEVQYFIWSTDNIGILATESLLRAADRGVKVKVIVDDLLIDAPDESLLALSLHPNISIKIYNPKHSVGTSFFKRILNVLSDFRGVNQRMHDKTFIVDGNVAITGGRNMADEYFDYNQKYNFRDRDVLVIGKVSAEMQNSFYRFWQSNLSVLVEERYRNMGLFNSNLTVDTETVQKIYRDLHTYAHSPLNFEKEVRQAINTLSSSFDFLKNEIEWGQVTFISDMPGKNTKLDSFHAGGKSSSALAGLIEKAKSSIIIQSPYLVLSDKAKKMFQSAINRGVSISISTNSLASTDNLQAFSGYKNQRDEILKSGITVYEYKAFPEVQHTLLTRYPRLNKNKPVFALHAKTMVIDSNVVYVGTYNLDPRSENLNTEVGIVVTNKKIASQVANAIKQDMRKENSWNAKDDPDKNARWQKRLKVLFYQLLPLESVL